MSGAADAALLAEQCVLGGLLLDNSARARLNGLTGEHFSVERHRTIATGGRASMGGRPPRRRVRRGSEVA